MSITPDNSLSDSLRQNRVTSTSAEECWVEIVPPAGWVTIGFKALWDYRLLVLFFAWRDLAVRYKQTFLGVAWAVLQPLLTMLAFAFVFGKLVGVPSDGKPYMLWSYAGLLMWQYVSAVVVASSNCLVSHQNMLRKVYFPRLVLPLSVVIDGLADLAVASVFLIGMLLWFGIVPTYRIVFVLPTMVLAIGTALGLGLWGAALNVRYRDVRYTLPLLMQLWLFLSPIAYPLSLVPEYYAVGPIDVPMRMIYALNPMVTVVEGFRWAVISSAMPALSCWWLSAGMMLLILVTGLIYFRRSEVYFADII